ncbi:MAG: hypothetical protein ABJE47_14535 [bacterium]
MLSSPAMLGAQQAPRLFSIDSLQFSALGLEAGGVRPKQAEPAPIVGIAADYGALSGSMRLRLEASYWQSRLTDQVVQTFTDLLPRVIADPSHDDVIRPSRVSLYDVTIGLGVRWLPMQSTVIQPFAGGGVAVHVINAEGPLIDGTFVEGLFDSFSTGVFAETGVVLKPATVFGVEGRIRGDLVNGLRSVSARVGGVYYFGPLRRINP